ncbi:hypothetical protein G6011_03780 [Alternaria panax]|uniref:Uncharacterized protein n=1 Tax=Alternaria panax TaxID=48097 RepID=A0AAD4IFV3_9PLEO|nr:hypothetical protein G6011_03780 [Alternaria panax]
MSLPVTTHQNHPRNSIFENDAQKRGFIIVIVLSLLATVGMICLIVGMVIFKNKRDRRKKASIMNADIRMPGAKGRYRKLEDEEEAEGGVWSVEMDDRRPTAYKNGQHYGQFYIVMLPFQKEKESTRLLREAFRERMRIEHPFTAEQLKQFDELKALLEKAPKLKRADVMEAKEAAKKEICTAKLDKQNERAEERRLRSLQISHQVRKGIFNSNSFAETVPTSLFASPSSPLWPRPELQEPVSSSATAQLFSTPLSSHVWLMTQTTFGSDSIPKTLCLCTTLTTAKTVLTHLADELALRIVFYVSEGRKRAQRTRFSIKKYAREDDTEFGFEACVEEGKKAAVDVKARWEEGAVWQEKISDVKIFGEGFVEVTAESVRRAMKG